MTRVLYWNIENFAQNKIANPSNKRQRGASTTAAQGSAGRMAYINTHWAIANAGVAAPPDIIVVVEVETGYDGPGILARGSGPDGARSLLAAIRVATGNVNWMLVPPLQTGPREAVAVFFDSANYAFTGPWQWPGGIGPSFDPALMLAPAVAAFAAPFGALLPVANAPAGSPNAGVPQNQLAASVEFTYAAAHPNAGAAINFGGVRAPYRVTLAELSHAIPPIIRNISLFCLHAPANAGAGAYLQSLASVAEIADGLAANEVRVVLGDLNVNLFTAAGARNLSYAALAATYAVGIDRPGAAPAPLQGYYGYYATHIKRGKSATYWTTGVNTDYYPGYGFVGSTLINNFYAIDNIFARYGGAAGGPMAGVTVLNGVVGSPAVVVLAPIPGNPPAGTYTLPISMAAAQFAAPAAVAPAFSAGRRGAFNGWLNYGRIRSTSDHLAIVADI